MIGVNFCSMLCVPKLNRKLHITIDKYLLSKSNLIETVLLDL